MGLIILIFINENNTLTIKAITYSGLGNAIIENNNIIYTPQTGFSGIETMTYVINDGFNDSEPASLTITVTAKPFYNTNIAQVLFIIQYKYKYIQQLLF